MKKIYAKIIVWFILSTIICTIIYLISSIMQASFDIIDWHGVGRFLTGLIMAVAICVTGNEVSDLEE